MSPLKVHVSLSYFRDTMWSEPVEEKTSFVEATCQNYEVLVEDKCVGKIGGAGPSQRYETQFGQK